MHRRRVAPEGAALAKEFQGPVRRAFSFWVSRSFSRGAEAAFFFGMRRMDESGFAPGLFGLWPDHPAYGVPQPEGQALSPEIKAAGLPDEGELRLLLNDMTLEMRGQFDAFRTLREASAPLMAGEADEAAGKLARADLKAAADAMSLIVRTLEKIDTLQRQMARDRQQADERNAEPQGYDDAKRHFLDLIERRAEERARLLFADWLRNGAGTVAGAGGGAGPGEGESGSG